MHKTGRRGHKRRKYTAGRGLCVLLLTGMAAALSGCSLLGRVYEPLWNSTNETEKVVININSEFLEETETAVRPSEAEEEIVSDNGNNGIYAVSEDGPVAIGDIVSPRLLPARCILTREQVEATGTDSFFWQSEITDSIFERINGKSYSDGCTVPRENLRYLHVIHFDFDGRIRVGELICNQSVSDDMLYIFNKLFGVEYQIEKMVLVDEYGGDDDASASDNNTSCFNYRNVAESSRLSMHALGLAIDVNPLYNPYVTHRGQKCSPPEGEAYMDRDQHFEHKIDEYDYCYMLFTQKGFTWGGNWNGYPDYMHFSRSQ